MEDVEGFVFAIRPVKVGDMIVEYRWQSVNKQLQPEIVFATLRTWLKQQEAEYAGRFEARGKNS